MGGIAATLADEAIVTSDNPRTEDPQAIIGDILEGMAGKSEVVLDRAKAIEGAVRRAQAGDVILVAGKGHEQYQEIDGIRHPFSDAAVVRSALASRAS
jgi:UDP-N-acetylmuramoyl-L-alanyl-D-glutamate--2,6-diaminopimelate ligase